jgi:hypothetical protein
MTTVGDSCQETDVASLSPFTALHCDTNRVVVSLNCRKLEEARCYPLRNRRLTASGFLCVDRGMVCLQKGRFHIRFLIVDLPYFCCILVLSPSLTVLPRAWIEFRRESMLEH